MNSIDEIHNHIGRNNFSAAIKMLELAAPAEMKALVTGIQAEHNSLNFQQIAGTASHSQMQVARAQLAQRILNLANQIQAEKGGPKTILVVSANPSDTNLLMVRKEVDQIRAIFRENDHFIVRLLEYASRNDLITKIQQDRPQILHFSGHGSKEGIYLLEERSENHALLPTETLADIVQLNRSIEFVFLNSCFGMAQLRELRRNGIPEMIGMPMEIEDDIALAYSKEFYQRIANGLTYEEAYLSNQQRDFMDNLPDKRKPVWFEKL